MAAAAPNPVLPAETKGLRATVDDGKGRAAILPRALLGQASLAAATMIALRVLTDQYEFRNPKDAVDAAKVFAEIGRLEMGEATSIAGEVAPRTPEEIAKAKAEKEALIAELAERAKTAAEKLDATPVLASVATLSPKTTA